MLRHPLLHVFIAIFSIQCGASFAKELFPLLGATSMATLRNTLAALIMLILFRPWRGTPLNKKTKQLIFVYGITLGLMNLFFYKALDLIPQGITVALEFLGPLGLALILSKNKLDYLWVALALVGVLLLSPFGEQSNTNLEGIIYALLAALCWGLYIYFGEKTGRATPEQGMKVVTWTMCVAALTTLPFITQIPSTEISFNLAFMVIAVAVLSSIIPYSLEFSALKKIPPKTFGILMSLEPAIATLSGFLFLNERITLLEFSGIILISLASFGVARKHTSKSTRDL